MKQYKLSYAKYRVLYLLVIVKHYIDSKLLKLTNFIAFLKEAICFRLYF